MEVEKERHPSFKINTGTYWNTEMFLIQIHQFHFIIRDFFLVWRLKNKGNSVSIVLGFHCYNVIIGSTLKYLGHTATKCELFQDFNLWHKNHYYISTLNTAHCSQPLHWKLKMYQRWKHHINLSSSASTLDGKRLASDAISLDPLNIQESKLGNSHSGHGNEKSIT